MTQTFIPDIHADPQRLRASLEAAGDGPLTFLGDFIDAGQAVEAPDDRAVLEEVRDLIEAGRARAVMGNHELNAILYHTEGPNGPLRDRSEKNTRQHRSFLARFPAGSAGAGEWREWFLTLPLWLDGPIRAVHACWDEAAIATVAARCPDGRLTEEVLPEAADATTEFGQAVARLLTGPELRLPEPHSFRDGHGFERRDVRIAWWRTDLRTWREAALSVPDPSDLPEREIGAGVTPYPADAPPVLCGHYKMSGPPRIDSPRAASLDYPATPVVYRWDGEARLSGMNLWRIGREREN